MALPSTVLDWLLDSDPALRWQVERDLAGAEPAVWQATRRRVAIEGFGARLLAHQDDDGQWAGGAFFPADLRLPDAPDEPGQPWTATTWSLNALREWGLDSNALAGTAEQLAAHCRWEYDDLPYWGGEVDCCINAYTLANGAWLGVDVTGIAQWFLDHQMDDDGWNCEWESGSTRGSFHSTLNTVKGILSYEMSVGPDGSMAAELRAARRRGEEYLLRRRLLYRLSTGELVGPWVLRFGYPYRAYHTALNAADHFRTASRHDGVDPDPRLSDAIDVIRAARRPDGRWDQQHRLPGRVWFETDAAVDEPSKWLTFHATRVLQWWDAAAPTNGGAAVHR